MPFSYPSQYLNQFILSSLSDNKNFEEAIQSIDTARCILEFLCKCESPLETKLLHQMIMSFGLWANKSESGCLWSYSVPHLPLSKLNIIVIPQHAVFLGYQRRRLDIYVALLTKEKTIHYDI